MVDSIIQTIPSDGELYDLADEFYGEPVASMRAALERWGKPDNNTPVAWMYKGEPDFDGKNWNENWGVTTDYEVAKWRAKPEEPIPLIIAIN